MHWDFDMYIRNRVDTSPSPVDWKTMRNQLLGFVGFMLLMFGLGEMFPFYQPVVSEGRTIRAAQYKNIKGKRVISASLANYEIANSFSS